jgi:hypothetical protein
MKKVGCCLRDLVYLLQSTFVVAPHNTTERNIVVIVASCDTTYDIKSLSCVDVVVVFAMYFIAGALCLCNHCSIPCNATEIYCWLLCGTILHSFITINHQRHCFLRYEEPRYALAIILAINSIQNV